MSKVTSISKSTEEGQKGLNYISDIVADIKAEMVIVVMMDDEDREHEGWDR